MDVSVVIPTLNRPEDLKITIDSLIRQTKPPKEIIIVDQSDNNNTKNLIDNLQKEDVGIYFHYVHQNDKSLTKARNAGSKIALNSGTEIISMLDDDVLLDNMYMEETVKTFEEKKAVLVGGKILNCQMSKGKFVKFLNKLFLLVRIQKDSFIIQTPFNPTMDYSINDYVHSQWTSGCNHSFLREVALNFSYDESLTKYALGEDVDYSYRVYKKFKGRVYITPFARLQHFESVSSRLPNISKIYMDAVHKRYLFHKNIEFNMLNNFIYWWSRFGNLLKNSLIISREDFNWSTIKGINYLIRAEIFTIKNEKNLKKLDLSFFNDWLLKNK